MSFFVPLLSEFNSDEENLRARKIRMQAFSSLMKEQFQLRYYGNIEYGATEGMSVLERNTIYAHLVNQKKEERKAKEESLRKAKESRKSNRRWKK